MSLPISLSSLPIDSLVPKILGSFKLHPNAVVVAPPGSGKTTRVPPAIAFSGILPKEHPSVVLLQPRRVAARAAAARMAAERGWKLGEEIGYHIRFENRTSRRTRIRVLTEGILTRQIQSDPYLEGVGCVILDEFHERSIHTDLALALLREIQTSVRDDLRIVVMSATLNAGPVAQFLGEAPILEAGGKPHPVEIEYLDRADQSSITERTARALKSLLQISGGMGHILVFLPGIGEIRRVEEMTRESVNACGGELHVLHSSISSEDQDRALAPSSKRKIILATNIAETSITIDGVTTVIDSGFARVLMNDVRLGIDRLELRRISRASADQRAGRAGRTGPGRCLRLWTRSEDLGLEDDETPEIHRIDLAGTLLSVHAFGARAAEEFNWFDPPPRPAIERAERLLEMLDAIDHLKKLTSMGKKLAALPLHPRLGRLLLAGKEAGSIREAATLAALLSERETLAGGHLARRREAKWPGG